uniref:Uncharacterized protein n=1 Tax=Clytia hemisphaerica TaxID=252671 RepID=A0A7M5XKK9_9CNID
MIKVYSGCLRSIFEVKEATKSTHSYEDTEDCSFDLIYSDVVVNSCQIEFVKCYENGGNDYLVVMKQIEENKYYMIDIIQFDEECVNQYQRIPSIEFLKSEWEFPELFLDTESKRLFLFRFDDCLLAGFDFEGRQVFSHNFVGDFFKPLIHLYRSTFMAIWDCDGANTELELELFTIDNDNKVVIVKSIQLTHLFPFTVSDRVIVKCFDKYFLLGKSKESEREQSVYLLDIYTAKKTLTHKSDFPYRDVRFNWNVQEMVFLQRTRYEQPLKLQIVKISAFLDHDSLKHRARLACLTWYNKEYLINHLPKCLQKYLGIV